MPELEKLRYRGIMTKRLGQCQSDVLNYLGTQLGKFDVCQAELMSDSAKETLSSVRIPVAPFTDIGRSLDHGVRLYLAQKSTLRARPMQEHLSGYIMTQCSRYPEIQGGVARQAHSAIYHTFVNTSLADAKAQRWSPESEDYIMQAV